MRTIAIGDIHGGYKALLQLVEKIKPTTDDLFIFLGDYADGWSQTPEVIDFLIQFKSKYNCIFLKGNHDALCADFLLRKPMNELWRIHGGKATEKAYESLDDTRKELHLRFLLDLEIYHLDNENRLFVHAGFTNLKGVDHEYFQETFYWDRTLWELALSVPEDLDTKDIYYPKRLQHYKEIYIGHTPTTRYNTFQPMKAQNIWNIDTGAAFKGCLSALEVNTKQIWQSEPVYLLYPDEKGRN